MSNQLIVSPITLLLALILVLIALAINLKEDLGMTKDLIIGVVRANLARRGHCHAQRSAPTLRLILPTSCS